MASLSHKIRVQAPDEQVYEALTSIDGLRGWFTADVDGDASTGGEVKMSFTGKEPFRWRISQLEPPTHVHWDCLEGPGAAAGTSVTFELSRGGEGQTLVELDHKGWPDGHDAINTCNTLWGMLMGHLRNYAESGTADPAFS